MIVTPAEAAKLWCPMVRAVNAHNQNWNGANAWFLFRDGYQFVAPPDLPPSADGHRLAEWREPCIGSKCMMWRWLGKLDQRQRWPVATGGVGSASLSEEPPRDSLTPKSWVWIPPEGNEPGYWLEPRAEAQARRLGYCGLIGRANEI